MSSQVYGDYPILSYRNINVGTTGALVVAAAKGCFYEYYFYNSGAAKAYIKLYDKATAGTSSDTPFRTYCIGASQGANLSIDKGINFDLGLSIRATTGVADNDTGAPGANEVTVNIGYRQGARG